MDLDLVGIFEDAGLSAKSLDRPGLTRALAVLEDGKALRTRRRQARQAAVDPIVKGREFDHLVLLECSYGSSMAALCREIDVELCS
jgi:hypothetical protein